MEAPIFNVTCRTVVGQECVLEASPSITVDKLLENLPPFFVEDATKVELVYGGKVLNRFITLGGLGIKSGSTLFVAAKRPERTTPRMLVQRLINLIVELGENESTSRYYQIMAEMKDIISRQQVLSLARLDHFVQTKVETARFLIKTGEPPNNEQMTCMAQNSDLGLNRISVSKSFLKSVSNELNSENCKEQTLPVEEYATNTNYESVLSEDPLPACFIEGDLSALSYPCYWMETSERTKRALEVLIYKDDVQQDGDDDGESLPYRNL